MRGFLALVMLTALAACANGSSDRQSSSALAGLSDDLVQRIAPQTTSIVIMRAPTNLEERYFRGADIQTLHNTRSATKTITAMLAGIAAADGAIDLNAPIWPHVDDLGVLPDALNSQITATDLLTMSSALACNDNDSASPGNEENMYPEQAWAQWAARVPSDPAYARDDSGRGPFHYCTAGVVLLGHAVAQAVAVSLEAFAEERLFAPLEIETARWFHSPSGEPMPGGGLELSSRSLARLGWLLVDGGGWDGRQVLPADFVARMLTVQRQPNAEQGYGYLIWRRTYQTACGAIPAWYMAGNGGNAVVVAPEHRLVVVVTRTAFNSRGMHQQTTDLIERELLPGALCFPG